MMQLPTTQRPLAVFLSLFWLFVGAGNGGKNSAIANEPKREAYKPSPEELREAYARAERSARNQADRVYKMQITPHWYQNNTRFWYMNTLAGRATEFIAVDAEKGKREPAFDHAKLAVALTKALSKEIKPDHLPFQTIEFVEEGKAIQFKANGSSWKCPLDSYTLAPLEKPLKDEKEPPVEELIDEPNMNEYPSLEATLVSAAQPGGQGRNRERTSPDGKWTAFLKESNVWVRSKETNKETKLSETGKDGNAFAAISWSPTSTYLAAFRVEREETKEVFRIQSSPPQGGRALLQRSAYALPGDKESKFELWVFDVANGKAIKADMAPIDRINYESPPPVRWHREGSHFTIEHADRGHQRFRVTEVTAATGKTRAIIDEKTDTFINDDNHYIHYLDKTDEIIRASERDGWRHLYLIDAKEGKVKNQITKGPWVVRKFSATTDRVDEKQRQIYFRASGKNEDQDPYLIHYYRVNFDGTGLVALTEGDGSHTIAYSPDNKYLIDTYSRVDLPPVHELRRADDGKLVCTLEKTDISGLESSGWKTPEVFTAKGRDGKTDIWGVVFRPTKFDANKKYPVIENIYAGPQDSFVPKRFSPSNRMQSLAELGFIVVQCDGMGTMNRSKAFHDVCWKNLGDAGLPDRILWIKALAKKYPYVDAERVGVYGTSAGGQSSTGALLFHPEFYKVAVSSCGCHDNRMDKTWWNEQWMGYPVGPHYAAQSNITNAKNLQGKLFLIVGELDTNVPPESTLRLADALIKAGKDFELLVVPGMGHSDGGAYGERRRRDFFVRHLHGVEPPERNGGK